MEDDKRRGGNGGEDDSYVLEDTGESIEDIEAIAPKAKLPKGPELKTTAKAE